MRLHRLAVATSVALFLCLWGCSDAPKEAPVRRPAPQPVSAQSAFQQMFISARGWAPDAQPLRVAEIDVDEVKAEAGKAGAWEALFVSPSGRSVRRYVFSVVHRPARNLRGGVNAEPSEAWSAGGGAEPFLVQALKTDSTAAYEVAAKRGREYARKNPGQPVKFLLEKTRRFPNPAWRVYWGETPASAGMAILVDATTGEYLGTDR